MSRLTNSGTKEAKADVTIKEILAKLTEYEDTGLTPEQVQKLKERDTAKKPIKHETKFAPIYECPVCGCKDVSWQSFCDECGQRLDWSE